jgi:hypothetical protein
VEEGLFTLIFIVLLVLMSVMDALGRRRQRGRKMEEMEREEGAAAPPEARPRPGASTAPSPPQGDREGPAAPTPAPRETAEQMVPEDFWTILTGQAPPESGPAAPQAPREEAPRPVEAYRPAEPSRSSGRVSRAESTAGRREPDPLGRRGDPDPPKDPDIPFPSPADRISPEAEEARRRAAEVPPPPTRRSARWMEGVGGREEPDRTVAPIEAQEEAIYGTMEEPWGRLEDIAAGDLTEEEPPDRHPQRPFAAADHARRRAAGPYTRLLATGNVEDLRKAIVLREVLGPPVGFREGGDGPGSR